MDDSKLVPVPSEVVSKQGHGKIGTARGESMTAREHLDSRLAATYDESTRGEKARD